jgi:hypothetical protein
MGDTINWGFFKRHFWGELLRYQHALTAGETPAVAAPQPGVGKLWNRFVSACAQFERAHKWN